MALEDYLVPIRHKSKTLRRMAAGDREKREIPAGRASICFDCQKACGGCSWSGLDPVTHMPRFEPVPGWTATPTCLKVSWACHGRTYTRRIDSYYITACPEFVPDEPKRVRRGERFAGLVAEE